VSAGPVLLYDGDCGVCSAGVQLILRRERRRTLRFAGLRSNVGIALVTRHPELQGVDSLVWLEPGEAGKPERIFVRSEAVLRVADYLGGVWRIGRVLGLLPVRLRDRAYDLFARNRHRIRGAAETCVLPDSQTRARFLS
jgi:predicted DCC family thiol-disulfide oxidoreductase YuxK